MGIDNRQQEKPLHLWVSEGGTGVYNHALDNMPDLTGDVNSGFIDLLEEDGELHGLVQGEVDVMEVTIGSESDIGFMGNWR